MVYLCSRSGSQIACLRFTILKKVTYCFHYAITETLIRDMGQSFSAFSVIRISAMSVSHCYVLRR